MEAISRKKEVDEMRTVTLHKQHPTGVFEQTAPGVFALGLSPGWEQPFAPQGFFVSKTYFDLAGLNVDSKTLFFEGATSTTMFNPIVTGYVAGDRLQIVELMTAHPLTDLELNEFVLGGNFANTISAPITFDQTIYARLQEYVVDIDTQAWGKMVLISDNQIGSLEPTASDRIYSYKLVYVYGSITATGMETYPSRHILRATAKEEAEYQYLMRLKRSYELQNEPDRD